MDRFHVSAGRIALLSCMHCMIDFLCAFAVYGILRNPEDPFSVYLIYNFCAFALQMPLGIVLDMCCQKRGRSPLWPPFAFVLAGVVLTLGGLYGGTVMLGLGNALFHTGGGVLSMQEDSRAQFHGRGLGVFVAPGAIGLFLGAYVPSSLRPAVFSAAFLLFLIAGFLLYRSLKKNDQISASEAPHLSKEMIPLILSCLLVVILRGGLGLSVSFSWKTGFRLSFLAVLALASGKTAGGFLGARFGFALTAAVSLAASAVCFFWKDILPSGLLALFLFNMTMPMTLYALASRMKGMPGFAFGLLTFGLFAGFVLVHMGWFDVPMAGTVGSLVSLVLLVPCLRGIS